MDALGGVLGPLRHRQVMDVVPLVVGGQDGIGGPGRPTDGLRHVPRGVADRVTGRNTFRPRTGRNSDAGRCTEGGGAG